MKPCRGRLAGAIDRVGLLVVGVVPCALAVQECAPKAALEAVEAVEGVLGVGPGCYAEEIVAGAAGLPGLLYGGPLEGVGSHEAASFIGGGAVEVGGPVGRGGEEHGGQWPCSFLGDEEPGSGVGRPPVHQGIEMGFPMKDYIVSARGLAVEIHPEAEVGRSSGAHRDTPARGEADVVAGLGLHSGKKAVLFPFEIDDDGIGGKNVGGGLAQPHLGHAPVHPQLAQAGFGRAEPVPFFVEAILFLGIGGNPGEVPADKDAGGAEVGAELRREGREVFSSSLAVGEQLGAEGRVGDAPASADVAHEQQDVARGFSASLDVEGEDVPAEAELHPAPECRLLKKPRGHEIGHGLGKDADVHGASP